MDTVWSIDGNGGSPSRVVRRGQMYDELPFTDDCYGPSDGSDVPTRSSPARSSPMFSTTGRMVGGFGAEQGVTL